MPSSKEPAPYAVDVPAELPSVSDSLDLYVAQVGGHIMPQQTTSAEEQQARTRTELIEDAYDWMVFVADKWTRNRADSQDLVQEALLRTLAVWPRVSHFPVPVQRAWLKQTALHKLIDAKRKEETAERHSPRARMELMPDDPCQPHEEIAAQDARDNRMELFDHLTDGDRALFHVWAQQHEHEISVEEAAALLNMTEKQYLAGRRRVERKLKKLADGNESAFTGDPAYQQDYSAAEGSENDDDEA